MEPVVTLDGVSKKFCRTLKRSMLYGLADIGRNLCGLSSHSSALRRGEFWAVDDVSFSVQPGETLGIIGPNGSGKSTLLKMLNGIYWPNQGRIALRGKVGALIDVGAGFHPYLTGKENIFINGAILGMGRAEIARKFDEIVAFAQIGEFLNSPVKHYSSGMLVRLGFSIAIHFMPDILLLDEILAVGDIAFQRKSYNRIKLLKQQGSAIILVSHSLGTILNNCEKVLYLDKGIVRELGETKAVIDAYVTRGADNGRQATPGDHSPDGRNSVVFDEKVTCLEISEERHVVDIEIPPLVNTDFYLGIMLLDPHGSEVTAYNSIHEGLLYSKMTRTLHVDIDPKALNPGIYHCIVDIRDDRFGVFVRKDQISMRVVNGNQSLGFLNPHLLFSISGSADHA
jgi:ABC-type polysaccharide/polyol phosphate transport system ATPase subunit